MRTNHYELIAPVRTRDFGDNIEGTSRVIKCRGRRYPQLYRDAASHQTHQPVVLLRLDDNSWRTGLSHFGGVSTPDHPGICREVFIANPAADFDAHVLTR